VECIAVAVVIAAAANPQFAMAVPLSETRLSPRPGVDTISGGVAAALFGVDCPDETEPTAKGCSGSGSGSGAGEEIAPDAELTAAADDSEAIDLTFRSGGAASRTNTGRALSTVANRKGGMSGGDRNSSSASLVPVSKSDSSVISPSLAAAPPHSLSSSSSVSGPGHTCSEGGTHGPCATEWKGCDAALVECDDFG
jgi:hypothetical protein